MFPASSVINRYTLESCAPSAVPLFSEKPEVPGVPAIVEIIPVLADIKRITLLFASAI
ncbi:MAG: hypothetical protein NWS47_00435 [Alphaproteobacteria bacterium]|nr:hypothetical protein [Alphaproteobacteria bacterium]